MNVAPTPTTEDVRQAERAANMVSDCAMEAVALMQRGQYEDAARLLREAGHRADNARRKLQPGAPPPGLHERYLTVLRSRCAVLSPYKFPEVADELLAVRDAELDVITEENQRLARQVEHQRVRGDGALTCQYCKSEPATHLLLADFPAGKRVRDLVGQECVDAECVQRAREISTNVALYELRATALGNTAGAQ